MSIALHLTSHYLHLGTQEEAAHAYDIAAVEYRGINAVTNFDLSTYIRWLRPSENAEGTQGVTPQDVVLQGDSNCLILSQERDFSSGNSFTIKNPAISEKHEIIERKMPLSPWNKATSPTALSLLLRSSLFKELVEKTTITACGGGGDDEGNDEKPTTRCEEEDEKFTFYSGNDEFGRAAKMQRKAEENGYNQTGLPFWK